jgi:site-specific DNA-methyltransferase (adenine-specific)
MWGHMSYTIVAGDCLDAMRAMLPDSVDAIVTDPPYGLSFMSKEWDRGVPPVAVWQEALRVLKPGGRLLCFAGTRTMHRMWCNIEDAGFTIEDTIAWMYGSGFPKHRSKLKPAYEPICVARKGPVSELNIDECRIAGDEDGSRNRPPSRLGSGRTYAQDEWTHNVVVERQDTTGKGRWPANVMLTHHADCQLVGTRWVRKDHGDGDADGMETIPAWLCHLDCPVRLLDEQSGRRGDLVGGVGVGGHIGYRGGAAGIVRTGFNDTGGASRFFYVAKASRAERNAGLGDLPLRPSGTMEDDGYDWSREVERGRKPRDTRNQNHHPTVKPVDLMRHLVRLITPTDGVVLDPFMGSGTTGVACVLEARRFIGCELDPEYAEIARRRIANTPPSLFGAACGEAT